MAAHIFAAQLLRAPAPRRYPPVRYPPQGRCEFLNVSETCQTTGCGPAWPR